MPESLTSLAVLIAGGAVAGFAQGISGFAFAMIALSVWAWAIPPQIAAPLAVFGGLLGQLVSLLQVRTGYDLRKIAPLIAGGLIGVPIGVFALHNFDPTRFKIALGTLLTLYGAYGLLIGDQLRVKRGGAGLDAFIGVFGGALGGLGGMSGTLPALWTQIRGWKRDLRRATMQVYNIAMHLFTLTVYFETGAFKTFDPKLFALLAPTMLIPAYFGAKIYNRISERLFQRVVLSLLLLSGFALLYAAAKALRVVG